jgi:hypothetical protein
MGREEVAAVGRAPFVFCKANGELRGATGGYTLIRLLAILFFQQGSQLGLLRQGGSAWEQNKQSKKWLYIIAAWRFTGCLLLADQPQ